MNLQINCVFLICYFISIHLLRYAISRTSSLCAAQQKLTTWHKCIPWYPYAYPFSTCLNLRWHFITLYCHIFLYMRSYVYIYKTYSDMSARIWSRYMRFILAHKCIAHQTHPHTHINILRCGKMYMVYTRIYMKSHRKIITAKISHFSKISPTDYL